MYIVYRIHFYKLYQQIPWTQSIIRKIQTQSLYLYKDKHELLEYKKQYSKQEYLQNNIKSILKNLESNTYFLGLDLSSRSTGYTILNTKEQLIDYDVWSPPKSIHGDSLEISDYYIQEIQKLKEKCPQNIQWIIGFEMYMKGYHTGIYQTQGLFLLAEIHSILNYNCWKMFNQKPILVHPSSARSILGIKSTGQRSTTKQAILHYVQKKEPFIQFPANVDHYLDSAFDIADSYIISLYSKYKTIYNLYWTNEMYRNEFKKYFAAHYLISQKKTDSKEIPGFDMIIEEKYKGPLDRQLKKYISMECLNPSKSEF